MADAPGPVGTEVFDLSAVGAVKMGPDLVKLGPLLIHMTGYPDPIRRMTFRVCTLQWCSSKLGILRAQLRQGVVLELE